MSDAKRNPFDNPLTMSRATLKRPLADVLSSIATDTLHAEQAVMRSVAQLPADMVIEQTAKDYEELLNAYNCIGYKEEIHGRDFEAVEREFDNAPAVQIAQAMHKIGVKVDAAAPWIEQAYAAALNGPLPAIGDVEDQGAPLEKALIAVQNAVRPESQDLNSPNAQLELAFARQHGLTGKEHFNVPDSVHSQTQLIDWALTHHDGFALADIHTRSDAMEFLINHMALLKEKGVTTLYTEYADYWPYQASPEQLQAKIADLANMTDYTKKCIRKDYDMPVDEPDPDDMWLAEDRLILAAKTHGIRIVHIDKEIGMAWKAEPMSGCRVATTNFIMTDHIEDDHNEDRKIHPHGKYVVLAGMEHVTSVQGAYRRGNGFVSRALHIPLLAFRDKKDCAAPLEKSTNPNGPDVYMPSHGAYGGVSILSDQYNAVEMLAQGTIVPPPPTPLASQKTSLRKR